MSDSVTTQLRPNTLIENWAQFSGAPEQWAAGQQIGPFLLKRPLGQGGMGLVWLAEQQDPFVREVAIKVMLSEEHGARAEVFFQIERQALAQLSHRAIAQIYDAGKLPGGALFFAMEYVPGLTLRSYLDRHKVGVKGLAKLLVDVCMGIEHAHLRGLIHRDIKPANILVAEVDGLAQPKIIDFGIAVSAFNDHGASIYIAGTEAYMAPEQKAPGQEGIDTRTDVYALGAVLAECLYQLAGVNLNEDQVSTIWRNEIAASLAPKKLGHAARNLAVLPEELRKIAVKAMAHHRDERYESAAALAEDLRRWLAAEPVRAMGTSRGYVLRCFLRRNALASAAVSLIMLALLVGFATALYGLSEAQLGRTQAESALQLAERRRSDAEGLVEFMLGDFAEKLRGIGRLDMLDAVGQEALTYLAKEQANDSEVSAIRRARAYRTIAGVMLDRNQMDEARGVLELAENQLRPYEEKSQSAALLELSSEIEFRLGRISYANNDLASTERYWIRQLQMAKRAAALTPESQESRRKLANALHNFAVLEAHPERNRTDAALKLLDESIEIKSQLVQAGNSDSRRQLANAWAWRASVLLDSGRDVEGWRNQTKAVETLQERAKGAPVEAAELFFRSEILLSAGLIASDLGQAAGAKEYLARALEIATNNAAIDTTDMRSQAGLARIVLHAALIADAPQVTPKHRQVVDRCLAQAKCTEVHGPELQAMAMQLRERQSLPIAQPQLHQVLDEILKSESPKLDMLRQAAELLLLLNQTDPMATIFIQRLRGKLERIPESRRANIRYDLARRAFLQLTAPQGEEIRNLAARIDTRRAQQFPVD